MLYPREDHDGNGNDASTPGMYHVRGARVVEAYRSIYPFLRVAEAVPLPGEGCRTAVMRERGGTGTW